MEKTIGHKLAWPGQWQLRRCVRGMALPCGCVVGVYETYAGGAIAVIDVVASSCAGLGHDVNVVVTEQPGSRTA